MEKKMMKTIAEIVSFAIEKEVEAYQLYSDTAQRVKDASAKKLLEELAEEERMHEKALKDLSKATELMSVEIESVPDLMISNHLVSASIDAESDIQEVLIFAMKAEKEAYELYSKLVKTATEKTHKSTFSKLAQMELIHKNKLEALYDDMFYTDN
jgi:rubrerythrin